MPPMTKVRFAFLIEPPFCFRTQDGGVTGYDVEIARNVLATLGHALEPVETEFDQLLSGLARGAWHMTTGMFITDARKQVALFSRPIWALPDGLLVRAADASAITDYGSLAIGSQRTLAVVRDQVQHQSALAAGVPQDRIRTFGTYEEAAEAVASGKADAYASAALAHRGYIAQTQRSDFAVIDVPEHEKQAEPGAFTFGLAHRELRDDVDHALAAYLGSPEHMKLKARFGF
jgi:polar amino acid transport system substrate-binding protein